MAPPLPYCRRRAARLPRFGFARPLALLTAALLAWRLTGGASAAEPPADSPPPAASPPVTVPGGAQAASLTEAQKLLWRGRYGEAQERFAALAQTAGPSEQPLIALGLAACQVAQGRRDDARATLEQAAGQERPSARVLAELGLLAWQRGDLPAADNWVAKTLEVDADQTLARWLRAELFAARGKVADAADGYRELVDLFNQGSVDDPDDLRWIGLAAAQHARWNRLSDQFGFLVNQFYAKVLERHPDYWPAAYEAGRLYLEKTNQAEALRQFQKALRINPEAAEVYAALGELALQNYDLDQAARWLAQAVEINPELTEAHALRADWELANFDLEAASAHLRRAAELNPVDEQVLGRQAAIADLERPGGGELPSPAAGQIEAEVLARNPAAGVFYTTWATLLEERRQFGEAERCFLAARKCLPQMPGPAAGLGLMYLRLGREDEARHLLTQAAAEDPFHVRVSNSLEVLEVLADYETIESDHFRVRFDPQADALLARLLLEHLERVLPRLETWLGHAPGDKVLFEILNRARNTEAHGWFSARMVGLPYVGTVAACAGTMVALTSPNAGTPYHWGRVVEHELVHVINLEQTNFHVPHWFTEGLAVWNERFPRPAAWNQLLTARWAAGTVFNLDTINLGFVRPHSSEDWQLAYCQAELYVEYLLKTFGPDAPARLLAAFSETANTRAALERAFAADPAQIDAGYHRYLQQTVAGLKLGPSSTPRSLAERERWAQQHPDDADAAAELARALLERSELPAARRWAERACQLHQQHALGTYVLARLGLATGQREEALRLAEAALDRAAPQLDLLRLVAGLRQQAGQLDQAEALYRLGAETAPDDPQWKKRLAAIYLEQRAAGPLAEVLHELALADGDDAVVRKKLAQLALAAGDREEAARWANEALFVNVRDIDAHRLLLAAAAASGDSELICRQWRTLVELEPDQPAHRRGLAEALAAAGDRAAARAVLDQWLGEHPDDADTLQLREKLAP